jgi:flagellar hook-associated protein 1 FlgK
MSVSPALNIALQSLLVQQNGLNITGHNIANASTPGYSRQRAELVPALPNYYMFGAVGSGVEIDGIKRIVDDFLNSQIRDADSGGNALQVLQSAYSQIEGVFNELSGNDLSTGFDKFFGALHDLSANVESQTSRDLVVQQGQSLSQLVTELYTSLRDYHQQLDSNIGKLVEKANGLMDEIADLNVKIITHEGAPRTDANDLRDVRDQKLRELAGLLNISVFEQPDGGVNVTTRGMPLVILNNTFHLTTKLGDNPDMPTHEVVFEIDGAPLQATEGQIPATIQARDQVVQGFLDDLNQFAADFIYQFNRIHSQGVGAQQLTAVTSEYAAADLNVPLNLLNLGFTPRPGAFTVQNGSLTIDVVNSVTGEIHKYNVPIDLDGAAPPDTTLNGLITAINTAVPGSTIWASADASGRLKIDSLDPNTYSFFFSEDTSGVLAALGINGFFSGHDAATMDVSQTLQDNSMYLAAGKTTAPGDNQNLLNLIELRDSAVANNGASTFEDYYRGIIGRMGMESARTTSRLEVSSDLITRMENERETISGVSLDEEMTRMIQFQRAYQAAARYIASADAMLDTLINKV